MLSFQEINVDQLTYQNRETQRIKIWIPLLHSLGDPYLLDCVVENVLTKR